MKLYGLLGYPLTHSFSKSFFTEKFAKEQVTNAQYENFSFASASEAVRYLRSLRNLKGFNITIPHKVEIVKHLDLTDDIVSGIASCNCVRVVNGQWAGFNTDVPGFSKSLLPLLKPHHRRALVFGTGGASKAVIFSLAAMEIEVTAVSRVSGPGKISYDQLTPEIVRSHELLINTTPAGMHPRINEYIPIPYDAISNAHLAYDLIYNPAKTQFLQKAAAKGAATKNGEEMLIIQAEESWRIWNEG